MNIDLVKAWNAPGGAKVIPLELCRAHHVGRLRVLQVAVFLACQSNAEGASWWGTDNTAAHLGVHPRTLRSAMDVLEAWGRLTVERRSRRIATVKILTMPDGTRVRGDNRTLSTRGNGERVCGESASECAERATVESAVISAPKERAKAIESTTTTTEGAVVVEDSLSSNFSQAFAQDVVTMSQCEPPLRLSRSLVGDLEPWRRAGWTPTLLTSWLWDRSNEDALGGEVSPGLLVTWLRGPRPDLDRYRDDLGARVRMDRIRAQRRDELGAQRAKRGHA